MKTTKQLTKNLELEIRNWKLGIIAIFLITVLFVPEKISAEVILSDNFTVTSYGDVNTDYDAAGRQSGTVAPLIYSWWTGGSTPQVTNAGSHANKLLLNFDKSGTSCTPNPSYNFKNLNNGFSIEADLDIVTNLATHFISFGIFKDHADGGGGNPDHPGFDILIGKYLGVSVYAISIDGVIKDIIAVPGLFSDSNTTAKIKICATSTDFPMIGGSRISLFINNEPYPLIISPDQISFNYFFKMPPNGINNHIVIGNKTYGPMTIDNFVISTLEDNTLDTTAWTGDIDSGLDSSKVYSHAVSFGDSSDANINGIIFEGSAGNMSGDGWELKTASSVPLTGPTASSEPNVSPSSGQLVANYMESVVSSNAGGLAISGLTPGLNYQLSLFSIGSEAAGGRKSYLTSSSGINFPIVDQDEFGDKNGQLLTLKYTAPSDGVFSFSTTPETNTTPNWNWYAFCNEVIAPNAPDAIYTTQGAYTDKVHVYWTQVAGAQSYIVYRADANDISSTNISWKVATDYYDDSSVSAAQNYYYWVAAANTGGVSSITGSAMGFTASNPPDTPSANFPNGNIITSPVQFTATSYNDGNGFAFAASHWQVSANSVFSSIKWTTGENGPAISSIFASRNSIPEGTNYWRVRYKNNKNTWSEWSESNMFICVHGASRSGIFKDSFNVSGNGDVNLDCNAAGRQFGNAMPLNYIVSGTTEVGSDSDNPGELLLGQNSGISPIMSFESSDKFNIEFDVKLHSFDASTDWLSLSLGNDAQTSILPENTTGLGAVFGADGTFKFYKGTTLLHSEPSAIPAAREFHVFITTSATEFDSGDKAYCSVFVNGTPMVNNDTFNKYGYTLAEGFYSNYVNIYNYNEVGTSSSLIDNFKISEAPLNVIKIHPWTNDDDSLIDENKEYTHLVNIDGEDVTIKNQDFIGTGILTNQGFNNGDPHVTSSTWALIDAYNYLNFWPDTLTPNLTGNSLDLGQFGAIGPGSPAIMLSGLTPNSSNSLYIYSWSRENVETPITFPSSYGGAVEEIDINQYGQSNGIIIQVDYIADKNGKFTVAAVPGIHDNLRFFICGFANEETGEQNPQIDVDSMLAFGEDVSNPISLPLVIANIGGGVVDGTITGIAEPFSLAKADYYAVPGTNDTISVTFSPTEERAYTNVITLTGNGGTAEVILTGTGIPEPCLFIICYLSFIIYHLKRK